MFHKYITHRLSTDWLWHRNNHLAHNASVLSHKELYDNPLHSNAPIHYSIFNNRLFPTNREESAMSATASNKDSIVKRFGLNSSKGDAVKERTAEVMQDFRCFVQDIESLIKATADLTGEDLDRAKAKVNERIASAKKTLEDVSGSISERAGKTAAAANNYVHEQPWPIIGVGAVLGFLAGCLLTNRRE